MLLSLINKHNKNILNWYNWYNFKREIFQVDIKELKLKDVEQINGV